MKKTKIKNLEELRSEKLQLRTRAKTVEGDLNEHFKVLADSVKPITGILGKVSKVKNMFAKKKEGDNNTKSKFGNYRNNVIKVGIPLLAGGLLLMTGRKLLVKSIVGYGLGKATNYVVSKNAGDHAASIKRIFSRRNKKVRDRGIF